MISRPDLMPTFRLGPGECMVFGNAADRRGAADQPVCRSRRA
jgi:hypothetical protein